MFDAARQVIVEMKVAQISLTLLALERFAADVAAWQLVRVQDTQHHLQVHVDGTGGVHDAYRGRFGL